MSEPRFTTYFGMDVQTETSGESVVRLALGPQHCNKRGVVHGGVLSALLDTALGAAVVASIPKEWWCATTSLTVQFMEGARGSELVARGRVVRRGTSTAFAAGEALDEGGRLVASAVGSWHLWAHHPGPARQGGGSYLVERGSGARIRVGKIVAVGRNYGDHAKEMGAAPPASPILFLKPATAVVAGGGAVPVPTGLGEVHHEVELVVVIGRAGRGISAAIALEHVLGYAVGLDLTLRDVQARAKAAGEPWTLSKGFDGSAPISLVAPRDEVGDASALSIALDVNGQRRQESSTSAMIWSVAELVAEASRLMTLEPGDLLFTGTPAGVGPVKPGDLLEARIEKVGELTVRIESEQAAAREP